MIYRRVEAMMVTEEGVLLYWSGNSVQSGLQQLNLLNNFV